MIDPAVVAMIDQLSTADREAFMSLGRLEGQAEIYPGLRPLTGAIIADMGAELDRARHEGRASLCGHLDGGQPQPACWFPWAPGALMCWACARDVAAELDAPAGCDSCHDAIAGITRADIITVLVPAEVVRYPNGVGFDLPKLAKLVLCDLCAGANDDDDEA